MNEIFERINEKCGDREIRGMKGQTGTETAATSELETVKQGGAQESVKYKCTNTVVLGFFGS